MKQLAYIFVIISVLYNNASFATQNPLRIDFLNNKQTIVDIVKLQGKLTQREDPKILAKEPEATCFAVNIAEFIPEKRQELPVYGCIFSDQVAMNAALLRAGLFIHTDAGMATDEQLFSSKLMTAVGGHDFSGEQLVRYDKNKNISQESSDNYATYKQIEAEFDSKVLRTIITRHEDNFIFFSIINTPKFKENLSHELLHAQYYEVPKISHILNTVWQQVPREQKDIIIECLSNGGYDMNQHDLLLREFYSYFLQYNAENYLEGISVLKAMAPLAKQNATKIRKALSEHDINVLNITE